MVGFFDVIKKYFWKKKKKNVIFFKNKLKKRDEKTKPSFCKKPHSMWKIEKGLEKKKKTEKLKLEKKGN